MLLHALQSSSKICAITFSLAEPGPAFCGTHLLEDPKCTICPGAVGMGTPLSWRRTSSADLIRSSFRLSSAASADWPAAAPDEDAALAGRTASMSCCARLLPLPGSATGLVAWSPVGEVGADLGLRAADSLSPRSFASACAKETRVSASPSNSTWGWLWHGRPQGYIESSGKALCSAPVS